MDARNPSLEALTESASAELEILHPGGLTLTRELAEQCGVDAQSVVLDVGTGTGKSAAFLARTFGCVTVGIERSGYLAAQAQAVAADDALSFSVTQGNANCLPYADHSFDVVLAECVVCLLDKTQALREFVRVARPGGCVGIHDLIWQPGTSEELKERLARNEGERPETLAGWRSLFEKVGLIDVQVADHSDLLPGWIRRSQAELDLGRLGPIFARFLLRWGWRGLWTVWQSWRVYQSGRLGYATIVGRKPR